MSNIRTVSDLLKVYKVDVYASPGERLADFLNYAAEQLPGTLIDKRIVAKVAFLQKRTPPQDSDYVKKNLRNHLRNAVRILKRVHGRDLFSDKVDGLRATVDADDISRTTHRRKRNRVLSSIKSFEETDALVDIRQLKGDIRKEVAQSRAGYKLLEQYRKLVPALPPKKDESKKDESKKDE